MPVQLDVRPKAAGINVGLDVKPDKLKIGIDREPPIQIELNARRTLDGNILIMDHEEIDIVLIRNKRKCIVFAKESLSDEVYGAQDRLFRYMAKKGVVDPSTVRAGNVYGSMEGMVHLSSVPGVNEIQAALFSIHEYLRRERPYFEADARNEKGQTGHITEPEQDFSTELGKVPHSHMKGSLNSKVRPFGFMYNYSLLRQ